MSEAESAEAAPAAKKKSKLPLIIAAVVVLAGGGGGAWFFMSKGKGEEGEKDAKKEAVVAPAVYVSFEPPFVVNFDAGGKARFLQVAIQVMTRDPHVAEELELHNPVIRNDVLLLLSNQQYETLSSREGKEKLQHEALEAVRHVIEANGGEAEAVESVLFTSFVMQ